MDQVSRVLDVSEDLLHDIERADANLTPTRVESRNRVTAAVMREVGFSDDEIFQKLGCLPLPFPDERHKSDVAPVPGMRR